MSDLIDRQAALEAIRNCTDIFVNNLPTMIDKVDAQEALMALPSAEPEVTVEMVDSYVKPRHLRVISEDFFCILRMVNICHRRYFSLKSFGARNVRLTTAMTSGARYGITE